MRSIVVDFVRSRGTRRRGGETARTPDAESLPAAEREILRVDEALRELSAVNGRLVKIVEMRYFAGMKEAEIAEALSITERTVRRDWEKARMLLATTLR